MIGTVVRVGLLRMWHGKVEVLLTFVVPIAFFTVFAFIFEGQIGLGNAPRVDVALVDEDETELSRELLAAIAAEESLRIRPPEVGDGREPPSRVFAAVEPARQLVLRGAIPLAIVVPEGWTRSTNSEDEVINVRLLADSSDPVATQVVSALIQEVGNQILAERARQQVEPLLTLSETLLGPGSSLGDQLAASASFPRPMDVDVVDLLAAGKASPLVSMYAAGIAVMFLLFGAVGNAGTLLEEEESMTLERLMCSQLSMAKLLAGKWLLMMIVGVAQITVMFVWAQLAFGVDLTGHIPGFAVMTTVTAAAAGSFALTLAALCRSRSQLNAVSIILILCMSALGGSMVPRYVMSDAMQEFGKITFNAWALDGYMKVFWRELPVTELKPELTVLVAVSIVFLVAARLLARRWESL